VDNLTDPEIMSACRTRVWVGCSIALVLSGTLAVVGAWRSLTLRLPQGFALAFHADNTYLVSTLNPTENLVLTESTGEIIDRVDSIGSVNGGRFYIVSHFRVQGTTGGTVRFTVIDPVLSTLVHSGTESEVRTYLSMTLGAVSVRWFQSHLVFPRVY
jgi:hypothetical protein